MPVLDSKAVVRKLFETINEGRLEQLDECFASDFVNHDPLPSETPDTQGIQQALRHMKQALPDFRIDVEQMIAEGDRVAVQLRAGGTQRGEFLWQAPTNRPMAWEGLVIFRVENGKIAERWAKILPSGAAQQGAPSIMMMPPSEREQPTK